LISYSSASPLAAQNFEALRVERIAAGYQFTDGPVWSRDGYLVFSDVPSNRLLKFTPGEGISTLRDNTGGASGNAFDAQGRLYSCETHLRRIIRTDRKGKIETLADKWEGKRFNAPNDIVVRHDGHAYFTDPAFGNQADTRELPFFGVFHIAPKGEVERVAAPAGRPNGIALSPNGRILYVANSDEKNIRAYDLDRAGRASAERLLIRAIAGVPNGIRVDEKGNLYIAAHGVAIYSPQGRLLHTIEIAETPSNCAFGDADYQSLYITARTSVYRVRLDVKGATPYHQATE
jgi:gluconolactonase